MRLLVLANARIPGEKAHPFQIVQMCEAFAGAGCDVTLLLPSRHQPPGYQPVDTIWDLYGVEPVFSIEHLQTLDLYPLARAMPRWLAQHWERLAEGLVLLSFLAGLIGRIRREPEDVILFSRDAALLLALVWLMPGRASFTLFEAHTFPAAGPGRLVRRALGRRCAGIVVLTAHLQARYLSLGTPPERLLVAHDGVRPARFAAVEHDKAVQRLRLGWPSDAYIVGYLGRFESGLEGMDKGLDTLAEAAACLADELPPVPVRLALVGGPAIYIDRLRTRLAGRGMSPEFVLYPGQVPPREVPTYLYAFDVCVIPSPWNDFYAYYTSPLKLFEYMLSGRPLIASDLPSTAEIIRDGENGLLVPPGDVESLVHALRQLRDDRGLAARLAAQARQDVAAYTWDARARRILTLLREHPINRGLDSAGRPPL